MPRPAKSVKTQSRHNTKAEKILREEAENKLKGKSDKIRPPDHLTESQKSYFEYIVNELKESDILCNLDVFVLTNFSIAADRLKYIEQRINEVPVEIYDKDLMSAKDKYSKEFFRCCNELSLSPQARAKIGSLNLNKAKEEQSPLAKLLSEVDGSA